MKNNISIIALSFMIFLPLENLRAADSKSDFIDSSEGGFPRLTPLYGKFAADKPLDYFAINTYTDTIVASLHKGELVSRDSVMKLIPNVQEEDGSSVDKSQCSRFIDTLSSLMKITSTQRHEKESFRTNIDSFATMLKELAEIEPLGNIQKVMLLVQQKY